MNEASQVGRQRRPTTIELSVEQHKQGSLQMTAILGVLGVLGG